MSIAELDVAKLTAHPFVRAVAADAEVPSAGGLGNGFVVALSGGPDSTALLLALAALRSERDNIRVHACHVNHRLRGQESDDDESFCRELCRKLEVPLHVEQLDGSVSDEAGLREARYAVLASYAESAGAHFVVTAHTQDDQAETMLFRLFRGTGSLGLSGIRRLRDLSAKVRLLRPLLHISRADVLDFLKRAGVKARLDSSNEQSAYSRNYIRNVIVPAIAERFPGFAERASRCAESLQQDEQLLQTETERTLLEISLDNEAEEQWALSRFNALSAALRHRLVLDGMRRRGIEPTFERCRTLVERAASGSGAITLDAQWAVRLENDRLRWFERDDENDGKPVAVVIEQNVRVPGTTISLELGCAISVEEFGRQEDILLFPSATSDQALVDLSRVVPPIVVRRRLPGDVIRPFGMQQPVKLKKFIHTHKPLTKEIGGSWRHAVVLADQEEVLWVPGMGLSNKLKVGDKPTHRLRFMPLAADELGIG